MRGRVGVFVGVVLQRQLAVRLLDVAVGGARVEPEDRKGIKGGEVAGVARGEGEEGKPGEPGEQEREGARLEQGGQALVPGQVAAAAAPALFLLLS